MDTRARACLSMEFLPSECQTGPPLVEEQRQFPNSDCMLTSPVFSTAHRKPDDAVHVLISRSNCYPCSLGLGASFDIELVADVAGQIAKEARAKNVHVLLAPTVNLVRSPLAGRGFEFFSEDPYHAGMMGAAHVKAVQAQGISACLKHFVSIVPWGE